MRYCYLLLFFNLAISCNESKTKKENNNKTVNIIDSNLFALPNLLNTDSLKQTDFVATLETKFKEGKNYIYCPTMLIAWNEIIQKTGHLTIIDSSKNHNLVLLNHSKDYINSLEKGDYKSSCSVVENIINTKVEMDFQLLFKPELEKFDTLMKFKNKNVQGFGMRNYDYQKLQIINILYFHNNDNFIFKLTPTNSNKEIIFIKGCKTDKVKNFKYVLDTLTNKVLFAKSDKENLFNRWKYHFEQGETFEIPELAFNYYKNYQDFLGKKLQGSGQNYSILNAYQRNALVLNNKGAKIKSEAVVECAAATMGGIPDKIEKHLILDDTFYVIFKFTNKINPYLCLKIENDVMLTKKN